MRYRQISWCTALSGALIIFTKAETIGTPVPVSSLERNTRIQDDDSSLFRGKMTFWRNHGREQIRSAFRDHYSGIIIIETRDRESRSIIRIRFKYPSIRLAACEIFLRDVQTMSRDTFLFTRRCAIRSIDTSRAWNALRLVNLLSDEQRSGAFPPAETIRFLPQTRFFARALQREQDSLVQYPGRRHGKITFNRNAQ